MNRLGPTELIDSFQKALGDRMTGSCIYEREVGAQKHVYSSAWVTIKPEALHDAVAHLCDIEPRPHFSVISASDEGDNVELCYHFSLFYGSRLSGLAFVIRLTLPKSALTVQSITDLIPGTIFSEREQQEMMGVHVEGIPDNRRLFLPDSFPEGVYPWRRDETGPDAMLRVLGGRQGIKHE